MECADGVEQGEGFFADAARDLGQRWLGGHYGNGSAGVEFVEVESVNFEAEFSGEASEWKGQRYISSFEEVNEWALAFECEAGD